MKNLSRLVKDFTFPGNFIFVIITAIIFFIFFACLISLSVIQTQEFKAAPVQNYRAK